MDRRPWGRSRKKDEGVANWQKHYGRGFPIAASARRMLDSMRLISDRERTTAALLSSMIVVWEAALDICHALLLH